MSTALTAIILRANQSTVVDVNPCNVLRLPGWQNSGPDHWQSQWQTTHGYTRVEQHDWQRPLRGDWISRLEDVLLARRHPGQDHDFCDSGNPQDTTGTAVLVAHSLGCIHIAAWASISRNTHRVKAALLVAPPDVEREDMRQRLPSWSPVALQRLPFPTVVMASSNDPFCDLPRAQAFAQAWGSDFVHVGPYGHLNAASGLGRWPDAHHQLQQLVDL